MTRPKEENLSLPNDELFHWEAEVKVPNPRFDMVLGGERSTDFRISQVLVHILAVSCLLIGLGHIALCLSYLTHGVVL